MEGELWGLAMHPSQLMCTTVSDDCTLCVWDLSTNQMVASVVLMKPARCCCYSGDGKAIAVGMKDGKQICIYNFPNYTVIIFRELCCVRY